MTMDKEKLIVAVIQLSSGNDIHENIKSIEKYLRICSRRNVDLAVLPENLFINGELDEIKKHSMSLSEWHSIINSILSRCKIKFCVVCGGLPLKQHNKIYDAALISKPSFSKPLIYKKNHLFNYSPIGQKTVCEADIYSPGTKGLSFELYGWKIAVSICFDLRFPEFYRSNPSPDIIICSAAFTMETGKAHWEILLRARAIENQSFVLAANQSSPFTSPPTYGHSMIINPWGAILSLKKDEEGVTIVNISKSAISENRNKIIMKKVEKKSKNS